MGTAQEEIGKRFKQVREVFFNGKKISTRLFAEEFGETRDNISNYEYGRAGIPNRVLVKLYEKGFNPIYILTGEGLLYASNTVGRELAKKNKPKRKAVKSNVEIIKIEEVEKITQAEPIKLEQITVAAGNLKKKKK